MTDIMPRPSQVENETYGILKGGALDYMPLKNAPRFLTFQRIVNLGILLSASNPHFGSLHLLYQAGEKKRMWPYNPYDKFTRIIHTYRNFVYVFDNFICFSFSI